MRGVHETDSASRLAACGPIAALSFSTSKDGMNAQTYDVLLQPGMTGKGSVGEECENELATTRRIDQMHTHTWTRTP